MRARLRHAPPGREAIRRHGKRDERRRERERGGERSEGAGEEEEEGGEQGCNKGGEWRRGGVRMDVESDGGGAVRGGGGAPRQRFAARHSFVISFARTARLRVHRSPVSKEDKSSRRGAAGREAGGEERGAGGGRKTDKRTGRLEKKKAWELHLFLNEPVCLF